MTKIFRIGFKSILSLMSVKKHVVRDIKMKISNMKQNAESRKNLKCKARAITSMNGEELVIVKRAIAHNVQ